METFGIYQEPIRAILSQIGAFLPRLLIAFVAFAIPPVIPCGFRIFVLALATCKLLVTLRP